MQYGLFSVNSGPCSYPATAARVAQAAEAAGFDSLWAGEHVVLPDPRVPPSPMEPADRILDPVVALTFLAAQTRRVRLGTGIIILPQRNPLVLAKELASLDELSAGRLIFGIGVGYLEPEFRALGIPFADRGARTDDYLAAIRAVWTQPKPSYQGRFVSFTGIQAQPQRPHIPIVVGGHTAAAYRRSVAAAHGWYGFALNLDRTAEALAGLRAAAGQVERPPDLGPLEISVTPRLRAPIDRDTVDRYAALGVHRLILMPPGDLDESGLLRYVEGVGELIAGA